MNGPDLTRRDLLRGGALLAGSAIVPTAAIAATTASVTPLGYAEVTLLPGRARAQFDATLETLLAIDEAALIRPFREAIGQPVGAAGLGGWYDWSPRFDPPKDLTGFIPGHSFGQYVSALSRGYAASGDARAKAKVDRLVAAFAPTISPDFYRDYPLPAYAFDKTLVGLIDAHGFSGNPQALALTGPALDAVLPFLPGRALDRQVVEKQPHRNMAWGWDETYTLPENLFLAADRGAGARFGTMARAYLLDDALFDPLAAGRNVLPGRHAYSHMNALSSAMRAWMVAGDPKHLAAATNGLRFIEAQSFATGGWGPNEGFVEPGSGKLGESLATSHGSFETPCGTYGQFKLARALIAATGDSRWGDGMERLLYNASLGALPLKPDGTAFYYSDYNDAGRRSYYGQRCPCCSGTIGQLTADYAISAWLRDAAGLFVNLYLPSSAVWRNAAGEPALTLTQRGSYPLADTVSLTVAAPRPVAMALRLRIPAWAGPATRVTVNGRVAGAAVPGRFHLVTRSWTNGDRIDLVLDRTLRLEAVDDRHPDRLAVMQGPLALFALGDPGAPFARSELLAIRQREPGGTVWSAPSRPHVAFQPFFAIGDETTRLYQRTT